MVIPVSYFLIERFIEITAWPVLSGQSYESSGCPVPRTEGQLTCGWDGAYLGHRVPTALDAMMMLTYYIYTQFEEQSPNVEELE